MNKNIDQLIEKIKLDGLVIIPNLYTKENCQFFLKQAKEIEDTFSQLGGGLTTSDSCKFIPNPFRHKKEFIKFIYNETIDKILKEVLDEDYVLITSTVLHQKLGAEGRSAPGEWHTDSRYLKQCGRLDKGFGFIAMTALTDFTKENGSTNFVPNSLNLKSIPIRDAEYEFVNYEIEAGSVILFDSGIWHRTGSPSNEDRWAVSCMYGPWFMKPYFRFPEMLKNAFGDEFIANLSIENKRLFHFLSTPPLDDLERFNTLIKG